MSKSKKLNQLFKYTPCLKHLSICTNFYVHENYIQSNVLKIIIFLQNISLISAVYISIYINAGIEIFD